MTLHAVINDIEKMRYKRKPKLAWALEFDIDYVRMGGDDDLLEPLELVMMEWTGEMVAHDLLPLEKTAQNCQQLFWEVLRALPNRVMQVAVSKEMKSLLQPLATYIDLELVESELPAITEYRNFTSKRVFE